MTNNVTDHVTCITVVEQQLDSGSGVTSTDSMDDYAGSHALPVYLMNILPLRP